MMAVGSSLLLLNHRMMASVAGMGGRCIATFDWTDQDRNASIPRNSSHFPHIQPSFSLNFLAVTNQVP
jgi:hypothetical protein